MYMLAAHTQMHADRGRTRLHGPRSARLRSNRAKGKRKISHSIYVWAADTISAQWTGVVLSPLKRCCHNAFVLFPPPPPPPAGEGEQERHLMARMHSGDTAGLCGGWL